MEFVEANWLLVLIVVALALLIGWYIFHAARRTGVTAERRDVLDEGAAPAARNQALIDAPRAASPADFLYPAEAVPESLVAPLAIPPGLAAAGGAVGAGAEPTPASVPDSGADDLTRLKGVGPKLATHLQAMGIVSLAQIASWSDDDIDRVDAQLGRFQGRVRRDDWREQARLLAAGDAAAYAARFGNIT